MLANSLQALYVLNRLPNVEKEFRMLVDENRLPNDPNRLFTESEAYSSQKTQVKNPRYCA